MTLYENLRDGETLPTLTFSSDNEPIESSGDLSRVLVSILSQYSNTQHTLQCPSLQAIIYLPNNPEQSILHMNYSTQLQLIYDKPRNPA